MAAPSVDEAWAKPAHDVDASCSARRPPAEIPAATPTPPSRFEAIRTPMLRRREWATAKDYGLILSRSRQRPFVWPLYNICLIFSKSMEYSVCGNVSKKNDQQRLKINIQKDEK